jgi:hypothetical protein
MTRDSDTPAAPRPRAGDGLLLALLLGFAATSFLFDRAAGLDRVAPDSPDPFGRAVWEYGRRFDPLVAENPLFLRVMSWLSAFVFGPIYIALVAARLLRGRWPAALALAWSWAMLYSMVLHVALELLWPQPPNLPVFAAVYAPYVLAPVMLLRRLKS